jgi:hypothetical protein
MLTRLDFRTHFSAGLRALHDFRPRTVVLHQGGLLRIAGPEASTDLGRLHALVAAGTNLVVLANDFFVGTVGAANAVLAPYGLRFLESGEDEAGLPREERLRRMLEWQQRYGESSSEGQDVCPHPLTAGVRRLYWFRPSPLVCGGPGCVPLARNAAEPSECFAAAARPGGWVAAVGRSLWTSLAAVGWPYDNDRLLANLLLGGDAEA